MTRRPKRDAGDLSRRRAHVAMIKTLATAAMTRTPILFLAIAIRPAAHIGRGHSILSFESCGDQGDAA